MYSKRAVIYNVRLSNQLNIPFDIYYVVLEMTLFRQSVALVLTTKLRRNKRKYTLDTETLRQTKWL